MYRLILKLAFNNAFLRLSRTMLVIVMIAVSMSMMLSIQGLYDGMTLSMIEKTKRSDSGEISMYAQGYRVEKTITNSIKNVASIKKSLEENPEVDAVSVRIKADGLSATARKSSFSSIIGIDLKEEEKFGAFSDFLKKGEVTFSKRGVLLGSELAKTLKVKIGSKVIFSTQDISGEINAMALKVRGIMQTSNITLDATAMYVDRKVLQEFLGISEDTAMQIAIRSKSETLENTLTTQYKTLDIKSFLSLYPMLKQMKDMMVIFNSITFFIVMLVVFIGIMGVMYVSILERIREFGVMLSIGYPYKFIRLQIFLEALVVGLSGYIVGAILGYAALSYLVHIGLDLSRFSDGLESFGMSAVIYGEIKLSYFTSTLLAIIGASLFSVLPPLRKIKTMNTIEVTKVET